MFGGSVPMTRLGVAEFAPWFLTFARSAIAGLCAVVFLLVSRRRFPREHLAALSIAGLLLCFCFPGFMAIAMQTVPAAHGGVVLGILPLATAMFAVLIGGERPSAFFWLCGIAGSVLVVIFAIRDGAEGFAAGDWWLVAACLSASCGYVISGNLSKHMPGWEMICWALILMLPVSLGGTVILWEASYIAVSAASLGSLAYLGLFSMFLGFFAWNEGMRMGGISRIGQLQLLQTFVTLAFAWALLGEAISLETLMFAVAVLAVVALGRNARVTR